MDMATVVRVGCAVRIRALGRAGERTPDLPPEISRKRPGDDVVTIVAPGDPTGWLTPRTPLAQALLGRQVGDVVAIVAAAATIQFEILEVTDSREHGSDAGVAELADAALLKRAPEQGPGSSPGTRTTVAELTQ